MNVSFAYPLYAGLLLLLPLIWFTARRAGTAQKVLRCGLMTALIAALMQPVILHHADTATRVFILDETAGVTPAQATDARAWLRQQIASVDENVTVDVLHLGGETLKAAPANYRHINDTRSLSQPALVSLALNTIVAGQQADITFISNGLSKHGDWSATLAALKHDNVKLNWVELDAPRNPVIRQFALPITRRGESWQAHLDVEGLNSSEEWQLVISESSAEAPVLVTRALNADAGGEARVNLNLGRADADFKPLKATLQRRAGADWLTVDARDVIAVAQPATGVLVAAADNRFINQLQTLLGDGFNLSTMPENGDISAALAQNQLVVINDATTSRLPVTQQQAILDAIEKQGTGLFYSGGEKAFASGGMAQAPLSAALPVKLIPQKKQQQPSVALAVVIDSSGSMQGTPLELAKQVARLAVRKLTPLDQVGVVEFYGTRQWSVPLQPVTTPDNIERAIGKMQSMGATQLFPAIQEAYFGLRQVKASYRHILVITDAGIEEENYQHLLRFIGQDQINVSTVLVGPDTAREAQMAELANWGRGRFYSIPDEFSMVELDFHKPSEMPEPVFRPGEYSLSVGDRDAAIPSVTGYARTALRPEARELVSVANTADPLLASWQFGAGRVTTLTTQPVARGTENWLNWPDYAAWLATQLAETAAQSSAIDITLSRTATMVNGLIRYNYKGKPLTATRQLADGSDAPVALHYRAPGIAALQFSADLDEPVLLEVSDGNGRTLAASAPRQDWYTDAAVPRLHRQLLREVTAQSGGRQLNIRDDALPELKRSRALQATALYPWLLALALLLYFSDIICRRWPTASLNRGAR